MPVLTAAGGRSSRRHSIVERSRSVLPYSTMLTPTEFWAVSAVGTVHAWHLRSWMVSRSACRPAPPPLSDPAMLHTMGLLSAAAGATMAASATKRLAMARGQIQGSAARAGCGAAGSRKAGGGAEERRSESPEGRGGYRGKGGVGYFSEYFTSF